MADNNLSTWRFIGDVNPVEHGGIWIRLSEGSQDDYEFVKVQEWFDEHIAVATGVVCVSDEWIDREGVESYGDVSLVMNPVGYVESVVSYYGFGQFDSSPDYIPVDDNTESKVRAFLDGQGITF